MKLAINGGSPVRERGYPSWPEFDDREVDAVADVVRSGEWGGHPVPATRAAAFAERFAAYQGARHGVVLSNGTLTLEVALRALGIGWGDEVITTAITFEATYFAIEAAGALPVIVDVRDEDMMIDPDLVEGAITDRTKAIIPVHIGQYMSDMNRIMEVANRHSLAVVEDCAHAHGQQWDGRGAGCFGAFGSFSHQSLKTLTSGEGGTLLTDDEHLAQLANSLIDCGRPKDADGKEYTFGGNYRLGELHAALLLAQLDRFEEQRAAREEASRYFEDVAGGLDGIRVMPPNGRITRRSAYQYIVRIDPDFFGGATNDSVCGALEAEGVPCYPGFRAASDAELFQSNLSRLPVAVEYADQLDQSQMSFPVAEGITRRESVWLDHTVLRAGKDGIDDLVEALAKIQSHADEIPTA